MVEEEGWRRWLASHGTDEGRAAFRRFRTRQIGFQALMKQTRTALQACYAPDREHADRIEEVEINPIMCTPTAAIAADALIRISPERT